MKKVLLLAFTVLGIFTMVNAQTLEELKAQKAEREGQISALKGEIGGIQSKIDSMTRKAWTINALTTIGLSTNNFSNWLQKADPNTNATTIGLTGNIAANLIQDKYFWRNGLNVNLGWLKFQNEDDPNTSSDGFEKTADVFNLSSLFGYRLNEKWAVSALGEYRTAVLDNFNNPGYFDIGAGATWTPYNSLVVVFHPLNYNFVFADDDVTFESSLGCKIVADYTQSLPMGVSWKSNFSAFLSYTDVPNLSNWTWINGLSATVWKGVGVGFELGIRGNKQESYNAFLADTGQTAEEFDINDLDDNDNDLQTYWVIGLTYSLAK